MYCCIACLGCTDCSGMCACLPALCCWHWIVWCMHVSCIDSDVHSCLELWSAMSQPSWIRRYKRVPYYYYFTGGVFLTSTFISGRSLKIPLYDFTTDLLAALGPFFLLSFLRISLIPQWTTVAFTGTNLKQTEAQNARAQSTHKGVNWRSINRNQWSSTDGIRNSINRSIDRSVNQLLNRRPREDCIRR